MQHLNLMVESLLDDEDEMTNDNTCIVKKFLDEHYRVIGQSNYRFKEEDGMIIVNLPKSTIIFTQHEVRRTMESLTNGLFRFGTTGDFNCGGCVNLKSLEGAPRKCKMFICDSCESLTSLKGAPLECDHFSCDGGTNLKSLEGAPQECGFFSCDWCTNLKSLEGLNKVNRSIHCAYCKRLSSLKGCPEKLSIFNGTNLTSLKTLEGGPKIIEQRMDLAGSRIESLKGCPDIIKGDFDISSSKHLKKLDYLPKKVGSIEVTTKYLDKGEIDRCEKLGYKIYDRV